MKNTVSILLAVLLLIAYSDQIVAKTLPKDENVTSKFVCPTFKQELKNQGIIADTACIMQSEISGITKLQIKLETIKGSNLFSLAGIECFLKLRELSLDRDYAGHDSISLDLARNLGLEVLELRNFNVVGKLNVSRNKRLRILKCSHCSLNELDMRTNRELEILDCSSNFLSKLDLRHNMRLKEIDVRYQDREMLGGDPRSGALVELLLPDNRRTSSGVTKLVCGWNRLKSLDLDRLPYLKELNCEWCHLVTLNTSSNLLLESVICKGNYIRSLDFAHLKHLRTIICGCQGSTGGGIMSMKGDYRLLKSLILPEQIENSDMTYLRELDYTESDLSTPIDFGKFPYLRVLVCRSNKLSCIDVSGNRELQHLDCAANPVSSLELYGNSELRHLNVCSTFLNSLDLLRNTKLEILRCDDDCDYRNRKSDYGVTRYLKIILSKDSWGNISFEGGGPKATVEYEDKDREIYLLGNAVEITLR